MHFLLSNDDGYQSLGISLVAEILEKFGKVTVVAPDRDRSGSSNSLTLDAPLYIKKDYRDFYYVNGTPTDCVHLAITGFMKEEPDIIVSGINSGANLGDDVLYSGTVAAAMEGRHLGCPAIAFSQVGELSNNYSTATSVVTKIIEAIIKQPKKNELLLNINIPNIRDKNLNGYAVTRLGSRHKSDSTLQTSDPRGRKVYWVGVAGKEQDAGEGTDFHAIASGKVSVTPLQIDLTRHQSLCGLKEWFKGFE